MPMIRSFFRFGPFRLAPWCLALALLSLPAVSLAARNQGLVVTPLNESGGAPPAVQPGDQPITASAGQSSSSVPDPAGTTDTSQGTAPGAEGGIMHPFSEQPSYKDGITMAYLVELMRKQDKPCPSGTRPPVPPSLLFSEPLCRVAESVDKGAEFPAAYEEQGIYAARWRMFSASDLPAQTVATRLRAEHCEALFEPYTHIGAWRGPSGWRIVLATLTDKPQTGPALDPAAIPAVPGASGEAPASAAPGGQAPASAAPALSSLESIPAPVPVPDTGGAEPFPALSVPPSAPEPGPARPEGGQEARALFSLINDLRVKGGSCLGRGRVTAPPLAFNAALQTAAEKSAAGAAAAGSFGTLHGALPDQTAEMSDYHAAKVSKLTAASRAPVSAVLDVWMVSPERCDALLSSDFTDAGAAYVDGYWVVLLGRRAEIAPDPKKN